MAKQGLEAVLETLQAQQRTDERLMELHNQMFESVFRALDRLQHVYD